MLAIGTGAAVVGLTGRSASRRRDPGAGWRSLLLIAGAVAGVALLLWPPFVRRLLRLAAPDAGRADAALASGIAFGIAANLSPGSATALALWLLARGLLPSAGLDPALAIAVFTASYLAGFLALFAPGGLGVREGLFILMLQGPLGIARRDGAGARLAGAAHDHRVRGRGAVSRLLAAERACRTLSPPRPNSFEPRRPRARRRRVCVLAALTLCWPMLAGQFLLGDDQYVAGYGFRLFGAEMFRADRPHPGVESLSVRRPAVHRALSTATSSIRPRGSAGCCRSTPR